MRQIILMALCLSLFAGCAQRTHPTQENDLKHKPFVQLQHGKVKKDLNTVDIFHPVTSKPEYFFMKRPGYLIGLEKINYRTVGRAQWEQQDTNDDNPYIDIRNEDYPGGERVLSWIECRLGKFCLGQSNIKTHIPTHIAKYGKSAANATLIYNAYGTQYYGEEAPCSPRVPNDRLPDDKTNGYPNKACSENRTEGAVDDYTTLYKQGWDFIQNEFKDDLEEMVENEKATHIFLFSMGWNTAQWESIANFNDLQESIMKAASESGYTKSQFSPVFIGITWPSMWKRKFGPEDFETISDDADEIGITFANHIIQNAMAQVEVQGREKPKLVLVGHSLGALLLTRAADSGFFVSDKPAKIDLLIGLQGAFTVNRFTNKERTDYLWAFPTQVKKSFYTSSINDQANWFGSVTHEAYVGSHLGYNMSKKDKYKGLFNHCQLDSNGTIIGSVPKDSNATFVDATNIIYRNVPNSSGKAHSDIYNPEVGAFMWQVIKECTIDNQQ